MARTLLPPNASLLERTVDATLPTGWAAMAGQVEPQANPPALLPWVAQQWQISQFESYFPTTQALLNAGLPWLRERGSAAAVRRAMGWLGFANVVIEEDGALLHINPGKEVSNDDLRRLAHVVGASIPLHVNFYRVFYQYDLRSIRLDSGPKLDAGMLDNDSGVPVTMPDGSVIIGSQGQYTSRQGQALGLQISKRSTQQAQNHQVRHDELPWLDSWQLDSTCASAFKQASVQVVAYAAQAMQWLPGWYMGGDAAAYKVQQALNPLQTASLHTSHHHARLSPSHRGWTGGWDAQAWQTPEIHHRTIYSE